MLTLAACSGGIGIAPTPSNEAPLAGTAVPTQTSPVDALPTQAEIEEARVDVEKLSTRRLAAQLVVPRRENDTVAAASGIRDVGYGGAVHFAEHTPERAEDVVEGVTRANMRLEQAVAADRSWPAFIAVDQEGGPVARIGAPLTQFGAAMGLGAAGDPDLAREVGAGAARELAELGFTVVLAPVADVTVGPSDPTIGVRSPGSDPQLVASIASGLAEGYADAGLVSVAKHFPGHGSVTGDTHTGEVHQDASVEELRERDLVPFTRMTEHGAPAIMTAHVIVDQVDAGSPATFSKPVLTGLLREDVGFRGLVLSDALDMGAVSASEGEASAPVGPGEPAVRAVEAGVDVLLMPSDPQAAVESLTAAVESGRLTRERLVDSAARMVATLRHAAVRSTLPPAEAGSHEQLAASAGRRSITQLSGACGARLVGDGITVSGGTAQDRSLLTAAAQEAGLQVGSGTAVRLVGGEGYNAAEGQPAVLGPTPREDELAAALLRDPVAAPAPATPEAVTVALDVPYPLAGLAGTTLATYGRTGATMTALVEILRGETAPQGKLPVAVGGHPVGSGCGSGR